MPGTGHGVDRGRETWHLHSSGRKIKDQAVSACNTNPGFPSGGKVSNKKRKRRKESKKSSKPDILEELRGRKKRLEGRNEGFSLVRDQTHFKPDFMSSKPSS